MILESTGRATRWARNRSKQLGLAQPCRGSVLSQTNMKTSSEPSPGNETAARQPSELSAAEAFVRLRSLAHDLSNSIETIMQASYLLAQGTLDETSRKWSNLIDQGVRETAQVNRQIREILRAQTEKQK
jgi:hypothetical protein